MKKVLVLIVTGVLATFTILGCGKTVEKASDAATETAENEDSAEVEQTSEAEFVAATLPLPKYEYTGTEDYMAEISDYLIDYYGKENGLNDVDVLIPFGIIAEKNEDNPEDIVVYGSFNIKAFMLRNSTLDGAAGAYGYGQFNFSKADDGTLTITDAQLTNTYYDMLDLFSPVDGLLDKIEAISDDDIRAEEEQCISQYVNSNSLGITQWQEFGKAPVAILNAPETPEDLQIYTFKSALDYEVTYDMRKITLSTIQDNGDMFGIVEDGDFYSGTFMVVNTSDETDLEKAVYTMAADSKPKDLEFTDATVGSGYTAKRTEFTEKLDDGREFRYIFYGVQKDNGVYTLKLSTTYEEGVSDIDFDQLEAIFADMLASFK